jgi:hypothetical protein
LIKNRTNKLVFYQTEVPQREFGRTGLFGLEEMYFFVKNNQDLFSKVKEKGIIQRKVEFIGYTL